MAFDFEHEDKSIETALNNTPYHALKDKLEELGIEGVWKGGRKKTTMIEEAVAKLAKIKTEIGKGLNEEEAIERLPEIEALEKEALEQEVVEAKIVEVNKVEKQVSELELLHTVDGKLCLQSVEASIKVSEKGFKRNSFSGMKVKRKIYLDQLDALNILLEKAKK